MGDINADVECVEVATQAGFLAATKTKMKGFALDTLRWCYHSLGGVLVTYPSASELADQSGAGGASLIGMLGMNFIRPAALGFGALESSGVLTAMLGGVAFACSRFIHTLTAPINWSAAGGLQILDTYVLHANKINNDGMSLRIRASFLFSGSHSKTINILFGSETIATITTSATGGLIMDVEIVRTSATSQVINYKAAGSDFVSTSSQDFGTDINMQVQANVSGGADGDVILMTHMIQYGATLGT